MVVRKTKAELTFALVKVLAGEPHQLGILQTADHAVLLSAASSLTGPLIVTSEAVATVLSGLEDRVISPEEAQRWASFVRRGYVAGSGGCPIRPLDIVYDQASEDAVVEVIARLDELGDAIDGEVSPNEIRVLLQMLAKS